VLNPTSFASLGISYNQQLLQGFGERVNGRFIRIAKRRAGMSELAFAQRLSGVVSGTLNLYWDLSVAANDLKYKQRNFEIARQFLADTDKQIGAGAIPAIDRVAARSALAIQQEALSVAANALVQRENAMKDAVSWHSRQDPELEGVHVIAVDPLEVPAADDLPPLEQLLAGAGGRRPDLAILHANAEIAETSAIGTANVVLPTLNVGVASTNVGQTGQKVEGQSPDPFFIGGVGSALGQVFRRNFPNNRVGVSFNTQIRNTQAQADAGMDLLLQRQSVLAAQRAANQLGVDIANQVLALRQARTRYQAAIESRELIEKLLTGEEKKLLMGTSSVATVVGARRDLATAQSSELAAAAAYMHNRIALDQALGRTLEVNHVSMDGALSQ
jgi:outer membrane protein